MPTHLRFNSSFPALLLLCLVSGCPLATSPTGPTLRDAAGVLVERLTLGEGQRATLFIDQEILSVSVTAEGWGAQAEGDAIAITAPYGGTHSTLVVETTGGHTELALELRALSWRRLPSWTDAGGPQAREYFAFWVDPDDADVAWAYGGFVYEPRQFTPAADLWRLDLLTDTWTAVSMDGNPPARGGATLASGPDGVFLYGGLDRVGNDFLLPFTLSAWTAGERPSWTPVTPTGAPAAGRYQPAFFWVDAYASFFIVAGIGADGPSNTAERYEPGTGRWSTLPIAGDDAPAPRAGFFWTFQASAERLVLFGGDTGTTRLNDTWALRLDGEAPRWEQIFPAGEAPEIRRNGLFAYDDDDERLFVFGGTPDGGRAATGLWALDLTPGAERWSLVRPAPGDGDGPVTRSSGAAIYDKARHRIVLGFGNDENQQYTDLWALEL